MERFWSKTRSADNGCIEWLAAKNAKGYGRFGIKGRVRGAHRVAFELAGRAIPAGLCVMHTCDNRACVNPAHLVIGTTRDNNRDMAAKGRNFVAKGEKNGRAKLTRAQIAEILASKEPGYKIAPRFGISFQVVYAIRRGEVWL